MDYLDQWISLGHWGIEPGDCWAQASPEVQKQGQSPDKMASQRWWMERLAELGRRASDTLSSFSGGAVQAFWQTWEAADMQVSTLWQGQQLRCETCRSLLCMEQRTAFTPSEKRKPHNKFVASEHALQRHVDSWHNIS